MPLLCRKGLVGARFRRAGLFNLEKRRNLFQPFLGFSGYFTTRTHDVANGGKALPSLAHVRRQQFRNSRERGFRLQQQEQELLARHRLELCERQSRTLFGQANSSQRCDATLIDKPSCHAHIDQAANSALLKAALGDVRFQLRNTLLNELTMQQGLSRPSRPRRFRVDSDRGLKSRRAIHCEEHRLGELFLGVTPGIERVDDLLGNLLLSDNERIVGRRGFYGARGPARRQRLAVP